MEAPTTPPVADPQVSPMRMLRWEPLGATKLPGNKDGDAKKMRLVNSRRARKNLV